MNYETAAQRFFYGIRGENMKKGYIYAVLSAIMFGSAGIFIKFAYNTGIDSVGLLTLQYIFAVGIMLIITFIYDKKLLRVKLNELRKLAVMGIIGNTFMTVFYYKAFENLPVAMVTLLLYTYPIMVFLYSSIFYKTNISKQKIAAILMAFIGCILSLNLLQGNSGISLVGIVYGVLCAFFYAFMNLYTEKKLENINPITISIYSTMFSLLALLIYRAPYSLSYKVMTKESIICILLLAVFCEIIPLTLLYASIKCIGALKVSVISNLEIPSAMLISYFMLNEKVDILQIGGAVLIILAANIVRKKE